MLLSTLAALTAVIQVASRAGIPTTPTPGKLRVVENSGICETTPGVYQASGYGDISANHSTW